MIVRWTVPIVAVALVALCLGADEVKPPKNLPCFPGAVYRKAVSSVDGWTGIAGVVTLPTIAFDEGRTNPKKPGQYLDNPSVYLGGRSVTATGSQEIDAGLTWEVVREPDGTVSPSPQGVPTVLAQQGLAQRPGPGRPLLPPRRHRPPDLPHDRAGQAHDRRRPARPRRRRHRRGSRSRSSSKPISTFEQTFDAPGFGPGARQEFKRVNAIDQVGNEGKPVQPTGTRIAGAAWQACALFRGDEAVPFTPARFTDMRCPTPAAVEVTPHHAEAGGESITIAPSAE